MRRDREVDSGVETRANRGPAMPGMIGSARNSIVNMSTCTESAMVTIGGPCVPLMRDNMHGPAKRNMHKCCP